MIRALVFTLLATAAVAAPPPDADPGMADWFSSLRTPEGASCCSLADCRPADIRITKDGLMATTSDGQWVVVPPEKILQHRDNPTGSAVMCWNGHDVLCFVFPAQI